MDKYLKEFREFLLKNDLTFDPYEQYRPSEYVLCILCAETTLSGVSMDHEGKGLWPMRAFERTTCHWCHEPQAKGKMIIPFGNYAPVKKEGEGR